MSPQVQPLLHHDQQSTTVTSAVLAMTNPCAQDHVGTAAMAENVEGLWYTYYSKLLNRSWKRIRQEAIGLGILPKDCSKVVQPQMISSTDVSNPVVALSHYLIGCHQYIFTNYNLSAELPQGHPIAEWAYPELVLLDRAATEAAQPAPIVLRYWVKDSNLHGRKPVDDMRWDYGYVIPPVPSYWLSVEGVYVVGGVPAAIKSREREEEQGQREREEEWKMQEPERRAKGKADRQVIQRKLAGESDEESTGGRICGSV